jgi:hypothetical protein
MHRQERLELARARLVRILAKHKVANARTLEQKISDAGPSNQRIDPHILTTARQQLEQQGVIIQLRRQIPWYHLSGTPAGALQQRLALQEPIQQAMQQYNFTVRVGQALEIAVFRALRSQTNLQFFGHFLDLDAHDDSQPYSKEEPPSGLSGHLLPNNRKFDFVAVSTSAGFIGIEAKNIREWLYPQRDEIKELLSKCCTVDAIPVLIGRRIPFVTFKLLNVCGAIIHRTYNQLFPASEAALALRAKDKDLLGYHDIRIGNQPDARLQRFIQTNLPTLLKNARAKFEQFKDLLTDYSTGTIPYAEFAARVRRRTTGASEESDWDA